MVLYNGIVSMVVVPGFQYCEKIRNLTNFLFLNPQSLLQMIFSESVHSTINKLLRDFIPEDISITVVTQVLCMNS